jgi:hypothetical protein
MLYDELTGLKYIGKTASHPVVRFVMHALATPVKMVKHRLELSGHRSFRLFQIGRALSLRTASEAESFFMHEFATLNYNGLNASVQAPPVLRRDFELDMEEYDLSGACDYIDSCLSDGRRLRGNEDMSSFLAENGLVESSSAGTDRISSREVEDISSRESCEVMSAEEHDWVRSQFNPFPPSMIDILVSTGMPYAQACMKAYHFKPRVVMDA